MVDGDTDGQSELTGDFSLLWCGLAAVLLLRLICSSPSSLSPPFSIPTIHLFLFPTMPRLLPPFLLSEHFNAGVSHLQLLQSEPPTGADAAVVLDSRASDNRPQVIDRSGRNSSDLGKTSISSAVLTARL